MKSLIFISVIYIICAYTLLVYAGNDNKNVVKKTVDLVDEIADVSVEHMRMAPELLGLLEHLDLMDLMRYSIARFHDVKNAIEFDEQELTRIAESGQLNNIIGMLDCMIQLFESLNDTDKELLVVEGLGLDDIKEVRQVFVKYSH